MLKFQNLDPVQKAKKYFHLSNSTVTITYAGKYVEVFYEEITTALVERKPRLTLIIEEFNVKLQQEIIEEELEVGEFSFSKRMKEDLIHKKPQRKWTQVNPNDDFINEIYSVLS